MPVHWCCQNLCMLSAGISDKQTDSLVTHVLLSLSSPTPGPIWRNKDQENKPPTPPLQDPQESGRGIKVAGKTKTQRPFQQVHQTVRVCLVAMVMISVAMVVEVRRGKNWTTPATLLHLKRTQCCSWRPLVSPRLPLPYNCRMFVYFSMYTLCYSLWLPYSTVPWIPTMHVTVCMFVVKKR